MSGRDVRWMVEIAAGRVRRVRHLHPPRFTARTVGRTSGGEAVVRVVWDGPVPGRAEIDRLMAEADGRLQAAAEAVLADLAALRGDE